MDASPIEEIKSRLDAVEFISQYLKLRKTGANFSAVCPFHAEKSASFFVSPTRQTWRCFGCGKGGDIFTFVQDIEGVEFGDALRILAAKAGVELKKQTRQAIEMKTERQRFYEACELAARFFEKQLASSAPGREVKKYLLGRGLSEESVVSWRIGWAPDTWQGLHDFLGSEGYTDNEIVGAGLAGTSDHGRVYDRFRGRIMFPIADFNSQVVGFGGRIFGEQKEGEAKYLNTANTLLYDKSRVLYGLDRAKVEIRKLNSCILVEGYTDVIMSAQAGIQNVAASSGTALTPYQLKILKRFTDNIILGYDMDLAGDTANSRGIDLALAEGFNVSVARPAVEDMDPADVIAKDPEIWRQAVSGAKTIMDFYFDRAFARDDTGTPKAKKEIAGLLLPQIKKISNAIEQSHWLQKLSRDLRIREEDLREELKKVKLNQYAVPGGNGVSNVFAPAMSRERKLEERLLVLILKFPTRVSDLDGPARSFFSTDGQAVISVIGKEPPDISGFTPEQRDYYDKLMMLADSETASEKDAANEIECHLFGDRGVNDCLLKGQLELMQNQLRAAENAADPQKVADIRQKIGELFKSVQGLKLRRNGKQNEPNI
ncbi:MAG: DNA primase [Candidatus Pacebacteria bacterium]|jgi:DNA primase|nr:DNA primase [Candidatus Paceibacterota bacterium]